MNTMTLVREFNPFFGWRGPNTSCKYQYNFGMHVYYKQVDYYDASQMLGEHFAEFKKLKFSKRVPVGYGPKPKFKVVYPIEKVWAFAHAKGVAIDKAASGTESFR